jgi:hypothetical protein
VVTTLVYFFVHGAIGADRAPGNPCALVFPRDQMD